MKINVDKVTKFSDSILFFFFVVVPFGSTAGHLTGTQGFPFPHDSWLSSWSFALWGSFLTLDPCGQTMIKRAH